MCGNFGLLLVRASDNPIELDGKSNVSLLDRKVSVKSDDDTEERVAKAVFTPPQKLQQHRKVDDLDRSLNDSIHTVSKLQGIRCMLEPSTKKDILLDPLKILEAQTACTEIRGGQAGGYSSMEYKYEATQSNSNFDALFNDRYHEVPVCHRVRLVARKRHPLAADLAMKYRRNRTSKFAESGPLSVICHTRFATSSANIERELHPHEWVPFHPETVWLFNSSTGRFMRSVRTVGIHITHNGDFDELDAYAQVMVNAELGLWLERILHATSTAVSGDSPKIAGMMDLLRVQGRWGPAARLAWVRCICKSASDVADGEQLYEEAPKTFPASPFWEKWSLFLDEIWQNHINNVVLVYSAMRYTLNQQTRQYYYRIDSAGVRQLEKAIVQQLEDRGFLSCLGGKASASGEDELGLGHMNNMNILRGFIHHTVRGFLWNDIYTCLTEFMSRAHGSFGIQVHSTMEPGIVAIASKGQPMSISFDQQHPIVLFGSEAEALALPVFESGKWLAQRLDLDSKGEVVRIGLPSCLQYGTFTASGDTSHHQQQNDVASLLLLCGIEIRSYSLTTNSESLASELLQRSLHITSAPLAYDPNVDLVKKDLEITPAVLAAIDRAWNNPTSLETIAARSLAQQLVENMKLRQQENSDTTDLLIGGVEASLWLAEQFAADLRRIFPLLNVVATSTNKLLGFGDQHPNQVFFPVADEILPRRVNDRTCVLLISQSGQTFSTLHATRKLARFLPERLWILTGCFSSKMEQVIVERYTELGWRYGRNRVLNNYSGHRPAEPSSIAVAATWHTLTRLLLFVIKTFRKQLPSGRVLHPWDYDHAALVIQSFMLNIIPHLRSWRATVAKPAHVASERDTIRSLMATCDGKILTSSNMESNYEDDYQLDRSCGKESCKSTGSSDVALADQGTVAMKTSEQPAAKISQSLRMCRSSEEFIHSVKHVELLQMEADSCDEEWTMRSLDSGNLNPALLQDPMGSSHRLPIHPQLQSSAFRSRKEVKVMSHSGNRSNAIIHKQPLMRLSDGCISDIDALLSESTLPTIEQIVGYDVAGRPLNINNATDLKVNSILKPVVKMDWSYLHRMFGGTNSDSPRPALLRSLSRDTTLWRPTHDSANPREGTSVIHDRLVKQGRAWADHIDEPWEVLVIVAIYVLFSVGLGLPLFGLIGDAILAIVRAGMSDDEQPQGLLIFSLRYPTITFGQPMSYSLPGLVLQIIDAFFFIYLAKHITRLYRIISGRPLTARHGKRAIVIVDNPTVHQLLENFVSKLYAQSYGIVSVEVHGASGLDHFVHRFTHRVVRGVLLAVGRPDGRLCCLAKSEASIILAMKQAAFIKNPSYNYAEGSGPEIVTIGHNPFQPEVGLSNHVILSQGAATAADCSNGSNSILQSETRRELDDSDSDESVEYADGTHFSRMNSFAALQSKSKLRYLGRRKFVDEYLYDRLFLAQRPFTTSILRTLRQSLEQKRSVVKTCISAMSSLHSPRGGPLGRRHRASTLFSDASLRSAGAGERAVVNALKQMRFLPANELVTDHLMPHGVHHIDPSILEDSESIESSVFADFVAANHDMLSRKVLERGIVKQKQKSYDPAVRLAFSSKLDQQTRQIQDRQVVVQQFYECRIASLERFLAFCVMFHAMAEKSCKPWLSSPWDIARSQSNLRVATTASPIGASEQNHTGPANVDIGKYSHKLASCLRGFKTHF